MQEPCLVILAAGMGSRFGGLKQITAVDENHHAIIDFSLYDAYRAGFRKVVFVIKHAIEEDFRAAVSDRMQKYFDVRLVFQELDRLPEGFSVPAGRVKPWGTGHAVLCAADAVDGPFAVINADDFYGRDAMARLGGYLSSVDPASMHFAMVGYRLDLTLSENGSVARGICDVAPDGSLRSVTEMTKLVRAGDVAENLENPDAPVKVALDSRVSMNCWGFTPPLFAELERRFSKFLETRGSELKSEWYIPFVVDELVKEGLADCRVLPTESSWFGVTYREDKPHMVAEIRKLVDAGEYPAALWTGGASSPR